MNDEDRELLEAIRANLEETANLLSLAQTEILRIRQLDLGRRVQEIETVAFKAHAHIEAIAKHRYAVAPLHLKIGRWFRKLLGAYR